MLPYNCCDTPNPGGFFFFFFMKPCDHKMPSIGIWLDSRLIDISIELKNMQNGLRMRKLLSSEVGVAELIP